VRGATVLIVARAGAAAGEELAVTPPVGWNSGSRFARDITRSF
jgi:hypothetical protein